MPLYDLEAARLWHQANIRPRKRRAPATAPAVAAPGEPPGDPGTRSWRDRLDKANAELRETELAVLRKDLLDVRKARIEFGHAFGALTGLLDSLPQKIAHELVGKKDIQTVFCILRDAVYELRVDIARTWEGRMRSGLFTEALKAMAPPERRE